MKINCDEFEATCAAQKVRAFPTVRIYRRTVGVEQVGGLVRKDMHEGLYVSDGRSKMKGLAWTQYNGPRTHQGLMYFARRFVTDNTEAILGGDGAEVAAVMLLGDCDHSRLLG